MQLRLHKFKKYLIKLLLRQIFGAEVLKNDSHIHFIFTFIKEKKKFYLKIILISSQCYYNIISCIISKLL